jgi:hypothetical protein
MTGGKFVVPALTHPLQAFKNRIRRKHKPNKQKKSTEKFREAGVLFFSFSLGESLRLKWLV